MGGKMLPLRGIEIFQCIRVITRVFPERRLESLVLPVDFLFHVIEAWEIPYLEVWFLAFQGLPLLGVHALDRWRVVRVVFVSKLRNLPRTDFELSFTFI